MRGAARLHTAMSCATGSSSSLSLAPGGTAAAGPVAGAAFSCGGGAGDAGGELSVISWHISRPATGDNARLTGSICCPGSIYCPGVAGARCAKGGFNEGRQQGALAGKFLTRSASTITLWSLFRVVNDRDARVPRLLALPAKVIFRPARTEDRSGRGVTQGGFGVGGHLLTRIGCGPSLIDVDTRHPPRH